MIRLFMRPLFVLFWITAIAGFLYTPQLLERVRGNKSISVLAWPNILDGQYVEDFEKETGIKVHITYFEAYEELFVKLRATGGQGYDLIMPPDYLVPLLVEQNLIKKIDHTQLDFWDQMHPFILNQIYDPNNQYSLPIAWSVYGLGVNKNYFGGHIPKKTWGLLFDRAFGDFKVGMANDAREIILIAVHYLFGDVDFLDDQKIKQVKDLLVKQSDWVSLYTDQRADYLLLSGAVPVAMGMHPDLSRAVRDSQDLAFFIPDEGSFMIIDSLVLPKETIRDDFVYAFINYLYRPDVLQKYVDEYGFFSPRKGVEAKKGHLDLDGSPEQLFNRLNFFKNILSYKVLDNIWVAIRS